MATRKTDSAKRGFTLIELLAVIAIILLLVSLLAPTLSYVKERVDFTTCLSNVRQLGYGANLHAQDNQGIYPPCSQWAKTAGSAYDADRWVEWSRPDVVTNGTLYQYVKNERLYVCPTFKRLLPSLPTYADLTPYATYSFNEFMQEPGKTWDDGYRLTRPLIQNPATQGLIGEENPYLATWNRNPMNNLRLAPGHASNSNNLRDGLASFHVAPNRDIANGYSSVWFADGHAAATHPSKTWFFFNPEPLRKKYYP